MTTVHIISDLYLGFNEFSTEDENIPDVDLVIINGNIGILKRGMLFAEALCNKYPDTQFVYNCGETEYHLTAPKYIGEIEESLTIRKATNAKWPKNLHWGHDPQIITLRNGYPVDVLCMYGYPYIHSHSIDWNKTIWNRRYVQEMFDDYNRENPYKPSDTSNVRHGMIPVFASKEYINKKHDIEYNIVKTWELQVTCYKILVTHINPYKDSRYEGQIVSPYKIHLNNGLWVGSDTACEGVKFLGANLYANPGRGSLIRSKIVSIN